MKLAIAGTGMIACEALSGLRAWGWGPAAICSTPRSAAKARALAERYGCPAVYTDYPAMLRETEADAIYLGVPNALHFAMASQALEAGRSVIVEKPLASNLREAQALAALAREKELFLYEAITTVYQPDYAALRENLHRVGTVKLVTCNFSQYSSRYDAFQRGETAPVFDPAQAGGALMDLNLYNIHWLLGLFGPPERVEYHANMDRGVDTSGAALLGYPGFQAVSLAAKDCGAPARYAIQGTKGCLLQDTPANLCGAVTLRLNGGTEERFHTPTGHRMEMEFRIFAQKIAARDLAHCYGALENSLAVCRVLTQARQYAGIRFPADAAK